jgi:hypothetical protein
MLFFEYYRSSRAILYNPFEIAIAVILGDNTSDVVISDSKNIGTGIGTQPAPDASLPINGYLHRPPLLFKIISLVLK